MIRRGALFALNHSGGKDSQAMTILLARIVPRQNLLAVHAPLGEAEWPGTIQHIEATVPDGVPLVLAPVASGKTRFSCSFCIHRVPPRIPHRGAAPSGALSPLRRARAAHRPHAVAVANPPCPN